MNILEKDFVPYEPSLALKELGFDEPCLMRIWWLNSVHKDTKIPFEPHISINGRDINFEYSLPKKHPSTEFVALELQAPTFSQAFRWFRDKYSLCIVIKPIDDKKLDLGYNLLKNGLIMNAHLTYEGAELACLRNLIKIVKEQTNGKQ